MTAQQRLLQTASNEIGYLEKASNSQLDSKTANAGYNNWTKYAKYLDEIGNIYNGRKNGYEWCDCFVDYCFIFTFGVELGMKLLCQPYGGAGAGCPYSAQFYKNAGQFYTSNPQPGDQIFFKNARGSFTHTGIVESVRGGKVYTIEGNTSSSSGVVANGGSVQRKSYNLNYALIGGYGRPDWSLVDSYSVEPEVDTTKDVNYQGVVDANGGLNCRTSPVTGSVLLTYPNGTVLTIIKENNGWGYTGTGWVSLEYVNKIEINNDIDKETEDNDMDVKRFEELWNEMRKGLQDNDCGTWSENARQWAVDTGLFLGNGTEINGSPNYMWQDVLTREQMATVLYRFAQMMGKV